MKINPQIQERIAAKVIKEREEEEKREMTGRMSANKLGWPLQWQMLNYYKVPQKPVDEYTLRKFQRGKDVEERIMKWLAPSEDKMQVESHYRDVIGYMDVLLDYPIEVKSCTNMAFKFKQKEGPSRAHKLQGELYAKAHGFDTFGVAYVASDDYRVLCFEEKVTTETDYVIDAYRKQVLLGTVPTFVAAEKWQADPKYNSYPEWTDLTEVEIAAKLESLGIDVALRLPLELSK